MMAEQVENPAYAAQLDKVIAASNLQCANLSGQPLPSSPAPAPTPSAGGGQNATGRADEVAVLGVGAMVGVGVGVTLLFALIFVVIWHQCHNGGRANRLPEFKQLEKDARRNHLVSSKLDRTTAYFADCCGNDGVL